MDAKTFNTGGPCDPLRHYMLPPEGRLARIDDLIGQAGYFVLHAPRQAGKTTLVRALAERLNATGKWAARWAERSPLPIVLLLDEIDALLGNSLVSVLRQLRLGFPERPAGFPQSIALIGLRDVRDYRLDVLSLRHFTAAEVAALCLQHQEATGQVFTPSSLERIFELTEGQPGLVNALARQIVEIEVPDRRAAVDEAAVDRAKERLILVRHPHLDSLCDRLRETRVRKVLTPVLSGGFLGSDVQPDDIRLVVDLGLLRWHEGNLEIANPIYREVIPRSLAEVLDSPTSLAAG